MRIFCSDQGRTKVYGEAYIGTPQPLNLRRTPVRGKKTLLGQALTTGDLILDPLDVPPAKSLDFAAQFEIAPDVVVVEKIEAINDHHDFFSGAPLFIHGLPQPFKFLGVRLRARQLKYLSVGGHGNLIGTFSVSHETLSLS